MLLDTKTASVALEYKRVPMDTSEPAGRTFRGLASTWGGPDLGGDYISQGAFKNSLDRWRMSGDAIPLINSHQYDDIFKVLGWLVNPIENADGLKSGFEVFDEPDGDRVLARVRKRVITGLSIGYRVRTKREPDASMRALGVSRILDEIELREVSLVLSPMNPRAFITSPGKGLDVDLRSRREIPRWLAEHRAKRDEEAAERAAKLASLKATQAELARYSIAPNDPRRIALDEQLRALKLRRLQLSIA